MVWSKTPELNGPCSEIVLSAAVSKLNSSQIFLCLRSNEQLPGELVSAVQSSHTGAVRFMVLSGLFIRCWKFLLYCCVRVLSTRSNSDRSWQSVGRATTLNWICVIDQWWHIYTSDEVLENLGDAFTQSISRETTIHLQVSGTVWVFVLVWVSCRTLTWSPVI